MKRHFLIVVFRTKKKKKEKKKQLRKNNKIIRSYHVSRFKSRLKYYFDILSIV